MKNWLTNCCKNVTNGINHFDFDSIFENLFGSYEEDVATFKEREEEENSQSCFIRFQHYLDNLIWDFQDNLTDALDKIFPSSDEEELENINEEYEEEYEETYEEDDEKEVPLKWHDYVVIAIGTTIYFFGFFYFATL